LPKRKKIKVTKEEQLKRLVKAYHYMKSHSIQATRANISSVANSFWVDPKLLENGIEGLAKEGIE